MQHRFPLFLDVKNKRCLVIGGGEVAYRKINHLLEFGAIVVSIASEVSEEVKAIENERFSYEVRPFHHNDIQSSYRLVIAATNDSVVNREIYRLCEEANIWINAVDNIENSTAIFPTIIKRLPVILAISTQGYAPTLLHWIRSQIEILLPSHLGEMAIFMQKNKQRIKLLYPNATDRRLFWFRLFGRMDLFALKDKAETVLEKLLTEESHKNSVGWVSLVGAGPGDPDLLTLKALRYLRQADIVFYDNLVHESILKLIRSDAELVYVGKKKSDHSIEQSKLSLCLAEAAKKGQRVIRLKGGDPTIFARLGEEIEVLIAHNIDFDIVPGITSATGCAAYAGITLTHRLYAQSVRFVTGHLKDSSFNLDWPELVKEDQTLVFYMGLAGLSEVMNQLIVHGMSKSYPVVLIEKGTYFEQKLIWGQVSTIAELVEKEQVTRPTLIILGRVLLLHPDCKSTVL